MYAKSSDSGHGQACSQPQFFRGREFWGQRTKLGTAAYVIMHIHCSKMIAVTMVFVRGRRQINKFGRGSCLPPPNPQWLRTWPLFE